MLAELQEQHSNGGVILTGPTGTGKTAFIGCILCELSNNSDFIALSNYTIAFYICQYQSSETINFIETLSFFLAKNLPEYKESMFELPTNWNDQCKGIENNCFTNLILKPLKNIQPFSKPRYIIIDALDACESILSLLMTHAGKFPLWIKFLLTTRGTSSEIISDLRLKEINIGLPQYSHQNRKDVETFVSSQVQQFKEDQTKLLSLRRCENLTAIGDAIMNQARVNFLYVALVLNKLWTTVDCSLHENALPNGVQEAYKRIFEGYLKNTKAFNNLLPVLEVMCAVNMPINIFDMSDILNVSEIKLRKQLEWLNAVIVIEPRNFTYFHHSSVVDWLTDVNRDDPLISVHKRNGHKRLYNYQEKLILKTQENCLKFFCGEHHLTLAAWHALNADDGGALRNSLLSLYKNVSDVYRRELLFSAVKEQVVINLIASSKIDELLALPDVNINSFGNFSLAPIFYAVLKGSLDHVIKLYNAKAKLDVRSPTLFPIHVKHYDPFIVYFCRYIQFCNSTLIHVAARKGFTDIVKHLLVIKKSLAFEYDDENLLPVHEAILHENAEIVEIFLNFNDSFADDIALYYATESGNLEIVRLLLKYGARDKCVSCSARTNDWLERNDEKNLIANTYGVFVSKEYHVFLTNKKKLFCETALFAAAKSHNLKILMELQKFSNASVNCPNFVGQTPLMKAIEINNYDMILSLMEAGADIKSLCTGFPNWLTPKFIGNNSKVTSVGESPFEKDYCQCGSNIFHVASTYNATLSIRKLLSKVWTKVEKKDIENLFLKRDCHGWLPVHNAICNSNVEILSILIEKGIVDKKHLYNSVENSNTMLHIAAKCLAASSVMYFLNDTIFTRVNDIDNEQQSALLSVYHPFPENVCIWKKFNVDKQMNFVKVVQLLMEYNNKSCKFYNVDKFHHTILHYAIMNYDSKTIKLLHQMSGKYLCKGKKMYFDNIFTANKTILDMAISKMAFNNLTPRNIMRALFYSNQVYDIHNETNMSQICSESEMTIYYLLFFYNVSIPSCNQSEKYVLHAAVVKGYSRIVEMLILKRVDVDCIDISGQRPIDIYLDNKDSVGVELLIGLSKIQYKCSKPLNESYFHRLAQENRIGFAWLEPPILNQLKKVDINKCLDANGYTILQRAAMGINWILMNLLIDQDNVDVFLTREFDNNTLLDLLIFKAKPPLFTQLHTDFRKVTPDFYKHLNVYSPQDLPNLQLLVGTVEQLLFWTESHGYLCKMLSCTSDEKAVKIFFAAAVLNFQTMIFICNRNAICKDAFYYACTFEEHNFTMYYFANLFGHHDLAKYLQKEKCSSAKPNETLHNRFLFRLLLPRFKSSPSKLLNLIREEEESEFDFEESEVDFEKYKVLKRNILEELNKLNDYFTSSKLYYSSDLLEIKNKKQRLYEYFIGSIRNYIFAYTLATLSGKSNVKIEKYKNMNHVQQRESANEFKKNLYYWETLSQIECSHIERLIRTFPAINRFFNNSADTFIINFIEQNNGDLLLNSQKLPKNSVCTLLIQLIRDKMHGTNFKAKP